LAFAAEAEQPALEALAALSPQPAALAPALQFFLKYLPPEDSAAFDFQTYIFKNYFSQIA
jgi:hypothetical protein